MGISQLAGSIKESSTLALNEKARVLRSKGEPVIHLGVGEPKNPAPIAALLNAAAKLNTGDIKYTPTGGLPSLKKAIVRYMEENYNKGVDPESIIVSTGAKQSLYNILYTIIDPQDEVILLAPYWVSYPEMVKMVHGIPVKVTPEDGSFHPRMEDIERQVTSYTKAIIVNNPCNPSGVVYSHEFIAEIVQFCEEKGIYLILDDIYQKLVENGVRPANAYDYTKKDIENSKLIIVNGVSKLYGMTGFRIGWVVARRKLIETMAKIQSQITSNASVISQAAAEGALLGVQSVVENLRLEIQNHREVMIRELEAFNGVRLIKPRGTFYCLPDFRAYETDSIKLSNFLLEKALVVTVPGVDFGMEGHLRLSYAGSIKDVTEGIERLKWALDPKAPNEIYIGDRKLERDWL